MRGKTFFKKTAPSASVCLLTLLHKVITHLVNTGVYSLSFGDHKPGIRLGMLTHVCHPTFGKQMQEDQS